MNMLSGRGRGRARNEADFAGNGVGGFHHKGTEGTKTDSRAVNIRVAQRAIGREFTPPTPIGVNLRLAVEA